MDVIHFHLRKIFFLFILFFTSAVFAQPVMIGQVVWVKGTVKVFTAPEYATSRVLQRRSEIYEGDKIVTEANSSGEIVLTDNSLLTLRENSTFKIDHYQFSPTETDKTKNSFAGDLAKGGFRTVTGLVSKNNPDGYQVKTPVATIGVRGTEYSTVCDAKQGCKYLVDNGSIAVKNDKGTLILDVKNNRYGSVASIDSPPIPLKNKPAEFKTEPPLLPAKVTPTKVQETPTTTGTTPSNVNETVPSTKETAPTKTTPSKSSDGFCISRK